MLNIDNLQIRNKLKSVSSELTEHGSNFKEAQLQVTLELDKLNNLVQALESDASGERNLVFAQISNLEKMIQRIAALPPQETTDDGQLKKILMKLLFSIIIWTHFQIKILIIFLVTDANAESLRQRIEYLAESSKAECDKLKFDLISIRDRSLTTAEIVKKSESMIPDLRASLAKLEHEVQRLDHNGTDRYTRLSDKVDRNWQEHSQRIVQLQARAENNAWTNEQTMKELVSLTNKTETLEQSVSRSFTDVSASSSIDSVYQAQIDSLSDEIFQLNDTMVRMILVTKLLIIF